VADDVEKQVSVGNSMETRRTDKGGTMSGPFIFIATNRLKPGKLAEETERVPGLVDFVAANEPRVIAFNEYANEAGTEVAVVQIHPDADSMAFHMGVIAERARAAYAVTVEATTSIQVFGMPSTEVLEMLERQAGAGVPLTIKQSHLGGFTR
jgi:hypothetical protein